MNFSIFLDQQCTSFFPFTFYEWNRLLLSRAAKWSDSLLGQKDYNPYFHSLVFLQYSQQEIFKKKHFKLFVWSCGGVATIVFPPESHFLHFPKNIHLPAPLYKHLTNVELNFVDFGTWPYLLSSMDRSIFVALDIRVFRFTSKSEYCFKAWGVHIG